MLGSCPLLGLGFVRGVRQRLVAHNERTKMSMSMYASSADYWKAQAEANAKDAERYRWLRDKGSATWTPFTRQWDMNAEHCDAAIDNEMATHGLFGAA